MHTELFIFHLAGPAEFLFWMIMVVVLGLWVARREDKHVGRR
jgi:hypothetical protein